MKQIRVMAQPDTFLRIARARPLNAIAELVWNGLDADASEVVVYFDRDRMGLKSIVVEDNGVGMTSEEAHNYFGKLGGSWKRRGARTHHAERVLHGSQGQGRYKSLSIGRSVVWKFYYRGKEGIYEFAVSMLSDNPSEVRVSDVRLSSNDKTGCIVQIQEPHQQLKNIESDENVLNLTELLATYLADYPNVKVKYAGKLLDVRKSLRRKVELTVPERILPNGERTPQSALWVFEWQRINKRNLFICDMRGFALQQVPTKFQLKKHYFSAYLKSPYFDQLEKENRLLLGELEAFGNEIIDSAKQVIKEYYDGEDKKQAFQLIEEWKSTKIYPYTDDKPKTNIEEAERKVFDIVAVKIHTAHTDLGAAPKMAKALQLELLRHAIETGPNQLRELLAKVVDLPRREQDDLSKLLEETNLSSIISAAKVVTDRLNFLRSLYQIAYEYEVDGRIMERSQLHRILSSNAWIFGEEFDVSVSDRDLTAVLKAHRKFLDGELVIDEPVKHINQERGIVDLMLSRLLRRHRPNEVEHLVVELKRPGVPVGSKEIDQITDYAASIEGDRRFKTRSGVNWNFWVISDKISDSGAYRLKVDKTGRGIVYETDTTKIYVKTWDQIIEECKSRYQFIQERLNFTAQDERAMRFLRKEHAALLDGVIVRSDSTSDLESIGPLSPLAPDVNHTPSISGTESSPPAPTS